MTKKIDPAVLKDWAEKLCTRAEYWYGSPNYNVREDLVSAVERLLAAHDGPATTQSDEENCVLGVGTGGGDLFVRGKYEAIKRVQTKLLRLEELEIALRNLVKDEA